MPRGEQNGTMRPCETLGIVADNLRKRGGSWGCVSAVDFHGRTNMDCWAHRGGKRFVVRADEILTAFLELGGIGDSPLVGRGRTSKSVNT